MEGFEYLYALEKYMLAVGELVGAENIRARLTEAYKAVLPIGKSQMPEHLRDKHKVLKEALTWIPVEDPGEGRLRSTLRAMDEGEADQLAKKFFEIYLDIDSAYRSAQGF